MRPDVWIPARTDAAVRASLAASAALHDVPDADMPDADPAPDRLGPADMLVIDHDPRSALAAIPHLDGLKVVQSLSAGVDRLVGKLPDGLILCDAAGVHDVAVSEWAVMGILAAQRGLPGHVRAQAAGQWRGEMDAPRWRDLEGARVLILGFGSIGRALEARLLPFGARTFPVARHVRPGVATADDLPALLPTSDIVVVLLPLTDATRGFVDGTFLRSMRPGSLLVNASRGAVVDTGALLDALRDGHVRAVLDVTDPEPLPSGHPLWSAPGVLITPHIASTVVAEEARSWQLVAAQVRRFAAGEPLVNVVRDGY